jgi:hypothetical protein
MQVKTEGRPGQPLAVIAMTGIHRFRTGRDFIAHTAAMAAAMERQVGRGGREMSARSMAPDPIRQFCAAQLLLSLHIRLPRGPFPANTPVMLKRLIPALALIAACQSAPAETAPEAVPDESSWRPVDPENLLLFDLGQNGVIFVELLPEAAPVNTAALRDAVRTGYFDGEYFYRVVETHVAQAGREFDQRLKDVPRLPLEAEREASTIGFDPLGSEDLYAAQVGHRKGFPVANQRGSANGC